MKIKQSIVIFLFLFPLLLISCGTRDLTSDLTSDLNSITHNELGKTTNIYHCVFEYNNTNLQEVMASTVIHSRDWRELFFYDPTTLACGNVFSRYVEFYRFLYIDDNAYGPEKFFRQEASRQLGKYIRSDDTDFIRFIIKEWLVKHPNDEQAWDLIEFYMCYQSKKYPYFSLIANLLEQYQLLEHPRCSNMFKYQAEMDQLAKSNDVLLNVNMFNHINIRLKKQGYKPTLSTVSASKDVERIVNKMNDSQRSEFIQLVIHSQDWNKLYVENKSYSSIHPGNIYEKLIFPVLIDKTPQYTDLLHAIRDDINLNGTWESWLVYFVINERLTQNPSDEQAWNFIEVFMPQYEGEHPCFTFILDLLEERKLLNTKRGIIMTQYNFDNCRDKESNIKPFNQMFSDIRNNKIMAEKTYI